MNSYMEYPINTSENNPYANRRTSHHRIASTSPSTMGLRIGSGAEQFRSSEQLNRSPTNQEVTLQQIRNLHHNKSSVKCDQSPPTPSGSGNSADLNPNFGSLNYNGIPPYCNQVTRGSANSSSLYALPQYFSGSEPYSSASIYGENLCATSQQMYSQFSGGFISSSTLPDNISDLGTNSVSCRINEQSSPPNMSFDSRSSSSTNRTASENCANTYDWMKIKRNPPKNGQY